MPQFLYRIEPTRAGMLAEGPTPRETEIIGAHFHYLEGLTKQGIVLMAGRTLTRDARTFGIVVFVAESETRAAEIRAGDPAIREGVMRSELFPYQVALWSDRNPMAK